MPTHRIQAGVGREGCHLMGHGQEWDVKDVISWDTGSSGM